MDLAGRRWVGIRALVSWSFDGSGLKTSVRFCNGEAGVVLRIGLVVGAEVRDPLNHELGIIGIAASEGTFCIGPVLLGLTLDA